MSFSEYICVMKSVNIGDKLLQNSVCLCIGGVLSVWVIVSSKEMGSAIWVQTPDEVIWVSVLVNTLGKGMNPSVLSPPQPVMRK